MTGLSREARARWFAAHPTFLIVFCVVAHVSVLYALMSWVDAQAPGTYALAVGLPVGLFYGFYAGAQLRKKHPPTFEVR